MPRIQTELEKINKKPYILVLTSTFPRYIGDHEPPFVFQLSRRLTRDFRVIVLSPHAPKAKTIERMSGLIVVRYHYFFESLEKLAYEGGILSKLKKNRWLYLLIPFFLFFQSVTLWKVLRSRRFFFIHAHWIIPQGLIASIVTGLLSVKPAVVVTSHGGDLFGLQGYFARYTKRWVLNKSDAITVVSNTMKSVVTEQYNICPDKASIISMGVDTQNVFYPDPSVNRNSMTILFVGRLVKKKGVFYLIQAMKKVIQQYHNCRLLIVGSGPEEVFLRQCVEQLQLMENIRFIGHMENSKLPQLYRSATMFVAPSIITEEGDQEGLGLVFAEALACRCPVIATNLEAIRDIIIDGETGILVPEKNSEALACAIIEWLKMPEIREKCADAGLSYVRQHFDWNLIADNYLSLFGELAQREKESIENP